MVDPRPAPARPVCVLGHHELDYPRNQVLQEAIRRLGRDVHLCHSRTRFPMRHFVLAKKLLGAPKEARVIFVTEGGHRLAPWVKCLAKLTGRRVLFDPFLSRYSTRVEDRKLHKPGSYQARVAHWQDWSSTKSADFLIFDTEEHRQYFYERYGLKAPAAVVPVGVPEDMFRPQPDTVPIYPPAQAGEGTFEVLFYGTYIPLQGIEHILDAAAALKDRPEIRFTLIGKGQTYDEMQQHIADLQLAPPQLRCLDRVPFETLPDHMAGAHVTLGIFGGTDKAWRVVPNKVVQAAACGRAIITADTPAIRRYFTHGESIWLVQKASGEALAEALRHLAERPDLRARLGAGARSVFDSHFSLDAISQQMAHALDTLEANL